MKKHITAVATLVALAATPAFAQEQPGARKFVIAPEVGVFIPTGDQRDTVDTAFLTGLTLSYEVHPHVALVGSFAWAATQGPEGHALDDDLDLFQYDLGVQAQYPFAVGNGFTLKPFVGAGLGARTYDYRDLDVDAETDLAGYFALGASLEYRNTMAGFTLRDYVSDYDGIGVEEGSSTRNDLSVFVSVGARF